MWLNNKRSRLIRALLIGLVVFSVFAVSSLGMEISDFINTSERLLFDHLDSSPMENGWGKALGTRTLLVYEDQPNNQRDMYWSGDTLYYAPFNVGPHVFSMKNLTEPIEASRNWCMRAKINQRGLYMGFGISYNCTSDQGDGKSGQGIMINVYPLSECQLIKANPSASPLIGGMQCSSDNMNITFCYNQTDRRLYVSDADNIVYSVADDFAQEVWSANGFGCVFLYAYGDVQYQSSFDFVDVYGYGVDSTYCGDGAVQTPNSQGFNEECDDGNTNDNDGCKNDCTLPPPTCGCTDECTESQSGCLDEYTKWECVLRCDGCYHIQPLDCSSGQTCNDGLCNDVSQKVVFRTNVTNGNYNGCSSSSKCWIAVDVDNDGDLEALGYTTKYSSCQPGTTLTTTPEGYKVYSYSYTKSISICDTLARKRIVWSTSNAPPNVELSTLPTEPYKSNNQETYG